MEDFEAVRTGLHQIDRVAAAGEADRGRKTYVARANDG